MPCQFTVPSTHLDTCLLAKLLTFHVIPNAIERPYLQSCCSRPRKNITTLTSTLNPQPSNPCLLLAARAVSTPHTALNNMTLVVVGPRDDPNDLCDSQASAQAGGNFHSNASRLRSSLEQWGSRFW